MFTQSMKLKGTVQLNLDHSLTFRGKLYDGTPFDLTVGQYDVQLNEDFKPSKMTVEGFLFVTKESQQADRCYLTLPKPTIQFGRQVTVSEYDLSPPNVKLDDFKAKPGKMVPISPDINVKELEAKVLGKPKKADEPGKKLKKTVTKKTKATAKSS